MRLLVGIAVLLHYPINQHVARTALSDLIEHCFGRAPHIHVLTVFFFAATVSTACLTSDLGVVFQLIGGLAGSLLVFVLPGALVVAKRRSERRHSPDGSTGLRVQVHTFRNSEPFAPERVSTQLPSGMLDSKFLGWLLILLGTCVFSLTVYLTYIDFTGESSLPLMIA
jgi:hypothetical protein